MRIVVVAGLLGLAACAGQKVLVDSDAGVVVRMAGSAGSQDAVYALAESACAGRGKRARFQAARPAEWGNVDFYFECVRPD